MTTKQNFIEINGKRYDALTGVLLHSESSALPAPATHKPVLDGFVKRPKHLAAVPAQRGGSGLPKTVVQKSKTLMRAAVKKPAVHTIHKSTLQQVVSKTTSFTSTGHTQHVAPAPHDREKHAAQVKKSLFIHKFGAPQQPAPITQKVASLEVRPAPVVQPTPLTSANHHSKTADLLDKALEAAQGHKEPFFEHKKPLHKRLAKKVGISGKAAAITTTIFAGLLLGGFYAYQNVPNLAMRVAATRAGFDASMPGYSPAGFAFKGPVQYSAGQVVVSFKSNTDDRNFKLTQQTSSWSSDSLLNNYVAASGKEYQTYQDRGRTIYIYDGSSATWVNGGVWYQVDGKSNLSSDQLVRIAASL